MVPSNNLIPDPIEALQGENVLELLLKHVLFHRLHDPSENDTSEQIWQPLVRIDCSKLATTHLGPQLANERFEPKWLEPKWIEPKWLRM